MPALTCVSIDVGVRNLGICIASCKEDNDDGEGFPFVIHYWRNVDARMASRKGKMTAEECVHDVVTFLMKWWDVHDETHAFIRDGVTFVIEAQMRGGGAINSVSFGIQAFLLTKGVKNVLFQSPKHKLSATPLILGERMPDVDVNALTRYECNKKTAIAHTQELLRLYQPELREWGSVLASTQKQDDMADAALHAFYWLYKTKFPNGLKRYIKGKRMRGRQIEVDLICCLEKETDKKRQKKTYIDMGIDSDLEL